MKMILLIVTVAVLCHPLQGYLIDSNLVSTQLIQPTTTYSKCSFGCNDYAPTITTTSISPTSITSTSTTTSPLSSTSTWSRTTSSISSGSQASVAPAVIDPNSITDPVLAQEIAPKIDVKQLMTPTFWSKVDELKKLN
jgi:hypothetical protein